MKLWIDDVRPAPEGYAWVRTVYTAQMVIECTERNRQWYSDRAWELYDDGHFELAERLGAGCESSVIELIDIDHDSGEFFRFGGDYICLLYWLEETGRNYPIRIHSANPVGVQNMRRIIQRNGWEEIK